MKSLRSGWKSLRTDCGLETCHNRLFATDLAKTRRGIGVGDAWYCSADCFVAAAKSRIEKLAAVRVSQKEYRPRLSIELTMVARGYLTEDQLRFAATEARRRREEPEAALLRLRLATEKQLAAARAAQWGCPALGPDHVALPLEVDLPTSLFVEYSVVPIHYAAAQKRLLLGVVHRVHHDLLKSIEDVTGCRPEPCFITRDEFEAQRELLRDAPRYMQESPRHLRSAGQMARALGGHALDIAAQKASFTLCGDYIWARVSGRHGTRDILFPVKNARENEVTHPVAELARLEELSSPADIFRGWWHNVAKTLLG
jgi:hypothetical protein